MAFLVLLTVFYQAFAWENRVTAQHSCYCDTVMFAAQSIKESGIEKYLPLSVCQYVWWGVIKIHLSYGS